MKEGLPRIGVLGAGQLALMLAEAGERLGVEVICAGSPGDCAERVALVVPVDLDDTKMVKAFAERVDVVTIESENIDEKTFFETCGIAVAPFAAVNRVEDLPAAIAKTGLPGILKTRRMGYDGKGQAGRDGGVRSRGVAAGGKRWCGKDCVLATD
jgi:5-(carboxyamino)imidazole ribonucleotide synthase